MRCLMKIQVLQKLMFELDELMKDFIRTIVNFDIKEMRYFNKEIFIIEINQINGIIMKINDVFINSY